MQVSDALLAVLRPGAGGGAAAACPSLRALHLGGTRVSSAAPLAALTGLTALTFRREGLAADESLAVSLAAVWHCDAPTLWCPTAEAQLNVGRMRGNLWVPP